MFSLPLVRYTLLAIRRDRVVWMMIMLMLSGLAASLFLSGAATTEQRAFSLALTGNVLRLIAVLGLVTFICFFLRRTFETREVDYLLGTPLSRLQLIISLCCGFIILSIILAALITVIIMAAHYHHHTNVLFWGLSLAVELSVTSMIAVFFASALSSAAASTLLSIGYYMLARMIGSLIGIISIKAVDLGFWTIILEACVKIMSIFVPRFDLMGQTAWLVYAEKPDVSLGFLALQGLIFIFLFVSAAIFDLKRAQF